jgi:phosphoglucosamine mutase
VIDRDQNTTGDGPMTAVTLFAVAARAGMRLHDLAATLTVYPQILINVRVEDRAVAEAPSVLAAVSAAELRLGDAGRILVRPSGTELLVRVMVEAADPHTTEEVAETVAGVIRGAAASKRTES